MKLIPGRHLRVVRQQKVSQVPGGPMLQAARQGLQVLPRLRELQLQGLHHREVLCQRAHVSY